MLCLRTFFQNVLLVCSCCFVVLQANAQCTLTADSFQSTNVTCNGLSNGTITAFVHGARGSVSYSTGGGGSTIMATQQFNSNVITSSTSTSGWYAPTSHTQITYSANGGCTGGKIGYSGSFTNFWGNFVRLPQQNCTGNSSVVVSFDLSNSYFASHVVTSPTNSDAMRFYMYADGGYKNATSIKIGGTEVSSIDGNGTWLKFSQARTCTTVSVTFDLSTVTNLTNVLFYLEANNPFNDSNVFNFSVDNVTVGGASTGQSSSSFTGLAAGTYNVTVTDSAGCTATVGPIVITQPNALTLSLAQDSVKCNGQSNGTVTAAGAGGTAPYTYSLNSGAYQSSNTFSNLAAATYSVTVKDANNCTPTTGSIVVRQPAALSIAITSQTNVSCNGGNNGTATAVATGGNGGNTYAWTTSPVQTTTTATNLGSGQYTVSVTDRKSCAASAIATLTQPIALNLTVGVKATSATGVCDGADTANITGGTTPYSYLWNGGSTGRILSAQCAGTYCITATDGNGCTATSCGIITQPSACPITFSSVTSTNVSCHGLNNGTITATAANGAGNYQYALNSGAFQSSGSFTGLAAGSYTVQAKDANCTSTYATTILITEPTALSVTVQSTNATCFNSCNGSGLASASGGTAMYHYIWNTVPAQTTVSVQNLCAGSYTVTAIDANNCTTSGMITITEPVAQTLVLSTRAASAHGVCDGTDTAFVTGGASPHTYAWSGTAQTSAAIGSLCTGNYCVTVADANGCTVAACNTVTEPTSTGCTGLTVTSTTTSPMCNGANSGTVTVTANGGSGTYSYTLNNNTQQSTNTFNNLVAGQYAILVSDTAGCIGRDTVVVTQPAALILSLISTSVTSAGAHDGSESSVVLGGVVPYHYVWSNGDTIPNISDLNTGIYCLTATDAHNCPVIACDTVGVRTGLDNIDVAANVNVYPNPFSESFTVVMDSNKSAVQMELFDLFGRKLWDEKITNNTATISTASLAQGVYLLRLQVDGQSINKRIVKQ